MHRNTKTLTVTLPNRVYAAAKRLLVRSDGDFRSLSHIVSVALRKFVAAKEAQNDPQQQPSR